MTKYAKIAFIAEKGVFPIFSCPRKLFTKMFSGQLTATWGYTGRLTVPYGGDPSY